ncbi:porin family protein [Ramlibacter tataouinensis]|uniref:Outer membrane protein beta-barrel domain-containing protein n=1 Tax=Ramlibacter tataouinensis (strain ATCC BAA-407 / DSM 14655 / LMG 21543 / TTB310) TaxID=365046 RepID=F5XWX1_RAMTT|nr:porin family protein [Ramlibacter tataouinensis]AEG91732.1 Hypothetical protein Rta_06540 [Ramlibacter tataouinensis TTB310]
MKKTLIGIAAASLLMLGTAAQAQQAKPPVYGEIGYSMIENDDLKFGVLRGIIGADLHPNVAVEGMLGLGVKDDSFTAFGTTFDAKIKNMVGVYAKPKFNVTPELELFGRVGFTRINIEASVGGASASDADSDLSYGVGLNYNITPTVHIGVDYMNYYDKDGSKFDGVTVGVGFRF